MIALTTFQAIFPVLDEIEAAFNEGKVISLTRIYQRLVNDEYGLSLHSGLRSFKAADAKACLRDLRRLLGFCYVTFASDEVFVFSCEC